MFPLRDSVRTRGWPLVNYALILINVFIFVKEFQLSMTDSLEPFIQAYGLIPSQFLADPLSHVANIFTSMFLHGSWMHVIGNMWYLYIFGDNIEDDMGHVRYFFYYLLMGIGAAAAQIWANPMGKLPMVGASGAIAGILGSYIVLHPHGRVTTLFAFVFIKVVEVPAYFFLGIWFLMQAVNGVGALSAQAMRGEMGGVAWWAHAGGFVAGFIGIFLFRRRSRSYF